MHERLITILRIALASHVTDIHFSLLEGSRENVIIEMWGGWVGGEGQAEAVSGR